MENLDLNRSITFRYISLKYYMKNRNYQKKLFCFLWPPRHALQNLIPNMNIYNNTPHFTGHTFRAFYTYQNFPNLYPTTLVQSFKMAANQFEKNRKRDNFIAMAHSLLHSSVTRFFSAFFIQFFMTGKNTRILQACLTNQSK